MTTEQSDFRERLIDAQQTTPQLREEYHKQLRSLLNHDLTPRTRLLTWAALLGSVTAAGLCVWSLVVHHAKPDVKFVLPSYAAVFLLVAAWLGRVLWKGGFARRTSYAVVEWLGSIFVGVYVSVVLLRGMQHPSDPAAMYWSVWALMLMTVGFAWGTGNRIAAATLETREHLLRLESRLADLADRVGK